MAGFTLLAAVLFLFAGCSAKQSQGKVTEIEFGEDTILIIVHNVMVEMRDGVRLATDIYRLKGAAPSPVLVARTPYNKNDLWRDTRDRYLRAGYAIVTQDVRGRYASEGDFDPHFQETDDGLDCFAWVASQPWSNGIIGTFGGSYLGGTQWLPARENPPALKAMVPEVTFSDMYEGNTHPGGVKVLHDLRWAAANIVRDAVERRRSAGEDVPEEKDLPDVATVLDVLPLASHPAIRRFAPFYREWIEHPSAGAYWDSISPASGYSNITAPAMNVSGWYDIFLYGTIQNYMGMKREGKAPASQNQKLVLGPWTHMNFTGHFPERDFGSNASAEAIDLDGMRLRWYDRWLKGIQNGIDTEDPVLFFTMGIDSWRTAKDWPLPETRYVDYFLQSGGSANSVSGNGSLSLSRPSGGASDTFIYDPMNPVPTVGGQVILPGENSMGPRDQREVELRPDVLVYTSPVLKEAVDVTGNVRLELYVSSDAPDTDFSAKLVDVYPDGTAMILTNGILRTRYRDSMTHPELMQPGKVYKLDINLAATSNVFLPGHRIRLEVSSSNFPQYARNSNTGGNIADEPAEAYRKAENTVHHSAVYPSRLILPVIDSKETTKQ